MPNYLNYQKSVSNELTSIKNRVRDFIESRHWGEDGRYKEIILSDLLKKRLPSNVSVGTGFVACSTEDAEDDFTSQTDIIIYDNTIPLLFTIENFVIVPYNAVLGIIEVKTKLCSTNIEKAFEKAHHSGELIAKSSLQRQNIFNGIFSYENDFNFDNGLPQLIMKHLTNNPKRINHISFGNKYFGKFYKAGDPDQNFREDHYSFYEIEDLSFGYFISNLIEIASQKVNGQHLSAAHRRMFYPIEEGKGVHRLTDCEIILP